METPGEKAFWLTFFFLFLHLPVLPSPLCSNRHPPLWKRIAAGACSGVVSAYVANPLDLIKTRLQAHGRGILLKQTAGAAAQPQMSTSFRSGWHSVVHSGRAVGLSPVQALWRGSHVNAVRSAFATGSNMPAYTLAKEHLLRRGFQDDPLLHMVCGFTSGIATCVANNPIDVLRSRLYNQPLNADGSGALYRGMLHAAGRILSAEGPLAFYKGFVAHCMRAAPHYILAFTFMEEIKRWLRILAPV